MPPSRHRSGNRAVKQATLSFGQKSRVSKASTTASTKKEKDVERIANSVSAEDSLDEQPTVTPLLKSDLPTTEVVIRTQAKAEIEQPRAEEDVRASKVTEADLKRYWKNEERKRRARGRFIIRLFPLFLKNNYRWTPAYVHYLLIRVIVREDGLDTYEKILRHFDLSSQYGVRLCFFALSLFLLFPACPLTFSFFSLFVPAAMRRHFKTESLEACADVEP